MFDSKTILAQAAASEPNPMASLVLMGLIFAIFYVVLILPMRRKQQKLDSLVKNLKAGDKVIINPGIFGTVVGVEEDAFQVRIADQVRVKVLKGAVAGLQGPPVPEKESK